MAHARPLTLSISHSSCSRPYGTLPHLTTRHCGRQTVRSHSCSARATSKNSPPPSNMRCQELIFIYFIALDMVNTATTSSVGKAMLFNVLWTLAAPGPHAASSRRRLILLLISVPFQRRSMKTLKDVSRAIFFCGGPGCIRKGLTDFFSQ